MPLITKHRATAVAVAWTLVILILCWMPPQTLPAAEHGNSWLHKIHIDKIVHITMFAGFSFLWRMARPGKTVLVISFIGVVLAALTELGQALPIVGRDAGWDDGFADVAGVVLGLVAWEFWVKRTGKLL